MISFFSVTFVVIFLTSLLKATEDMPLLCSKNIHIHSELVTQSLLTAQHRQGQRSSILITYSVANPQDLFSWRFNGRENLQTACQLHSAGYDQSLNNSGFG